MTGQLDEAITATTHYINGAWTASGGPTFPDCNPYNDAVVAEITAGGPSDAETAVAAAYASFPAWASLPPGERQRLFLKAADITERRRAEIVHILAVESAAPRRSPTSRSRGR